FNVALHKSINLNMSHYVRKFQYKLNSAPYTIFLYLKLILSNITLSVFGLILSVLSKNRVDKKHLFVVGCSPRTIYWNGFFNLLKTFQNNNDCYEVLLLAPQTVLNLPKGNLSKRKRLKIFLESYSFIMQIIKQKNLLIRE